MSDRRYRVDHVIPADELGGAEVAAKTAADRPDLGCEVRLLFVDQDQKSVNDRSNRLHRLVASLDLRETVRRIKLRDSDLVVASLWKTVPALVALRWSKRRRALVYLLHSAREQHWLDTLLSRVGIAVSDEVWADSQATLDRRHVPAAKLSRVVSFVARRLEPVASPEPALRFVCWGRLHVHKGYDRAIRLIALLVARGHDARLTIYGPDKGEGSILRTLTKQLNVDERIALPGPVEHEQLPMIAAQNAFFLQPSRTEGMCMAAVEAMQLGLVPVVTPVGEMARYVMPGRTGILIDPDRLGEAVDAIVALLRDPALFSAMSSAARATWADAPLYADDFCRAAHDAIVRRLQRVNAIRQPEDGIGRVIQPDEQIGAARGNDQN